MNTEFNSFASMLTALPTDTACREYLELRRWNGTPVCPHCGVADAKHYKLNVKGEFKGMYKCKSCKERFTVTLGTMFEGSPISLRKWFIATYIFASHKKGISSHQLARDLGVTQKTAWFMLHRLRFALGTGSFEMPKTGGGGEVVEVDEKYVGGQAENKHASKRIKGAQSALDKACVVGVLNRETGASTVVLQPQITGQERTQSIKNVVFNLVDPKATLITDSHNAYKTINTVYPNHIKVKLNGSYVTDKHFHTNNIEGFWSLLGRSILGIYHQVSARHLQAYCDESSYRYNTRKMNEGNRVALTVSKSNVRLTYNALIAK